MGRVSPKVFSLLKGVFSLPLLLTGGVVPNPAYLTNPFRSGITTDFVCLLNSLMNVIKISS